MTKLVVAKRKLEQQILHVQVVEKTRTPENGHLRTRCAQTFQRIVMTLSQILGLRSCAYVEVMKHWRLVRSVAGFGARLLY